MDAGYEYITTRRGYNIYRKIVNGKGIWKAVKDGKEIDITYYQALGYDPLDYAERLSMELGKFILPKEVIK